MLDLEESRLYWDYIGTSLEIGLFWPKSGQKPPKSMGVPQYLNNTLLAHTPNPPPLNRIRWGALGKKGDRKHFFQFFPAKMRKSAQKLHVFYNLQGNALI